MSETADIRRHVLRDGEVSVTLLSLGCITQEWQVPSDGGHVSAVLGYTDPSAYLDDPFFMGAIVGRVANRIAGASFVFEGERVALAPNEGGNHLHGGPLGFSRRNWESEGDGDRAVRFSLVSPDGDQGYRGRLDVQVVVTLDNARLTYEIEASCDRPTPVNLAQHSYYCLGAQSAMDLSLCLPADHITQTGPELLPTGMLTSLGGARTDFRRTRRLSDADPHLEGIDQNYVLTGGLATLSGNGLVAEFETDQPCMQLYSGGYLSPGAAPLAGQVHDPFAGVCLEPQGYSNAVNVDGFPVSIAHPDKPYRQRLSVRIRQEGLS